MCETASVCVYVCACVYARTCVWVHAYVCKVNVCPYIARYTVHGTAQSALHFTPWQTCLFQRHFDFTGKHSATLQLLREDSSFRYPSLSVLPGTHLYS